VLPSVVTEITASASLKEAMRRPMPAMISLVAMIRRKRTPLIGVARYAVRQRIVFTERWMRGDPHHRRVARRRDGHRREAVMPVD
jgi:hypothetical protein